MHGLFSTQRDGGQGGKGLLARRGAACLRPHAGAAQLVMATLLMLCFGMVTDGFTAYLPYLRQEYGITDAQVSTVVTMRCLSSFVAALFAHNIYGRISIRAGMGLAVLLEAAGFAVCACFPGFAGACVGCLLMGVTCGMGSTVPASMLMHRWYGARVAMPLCVCMAGSGLASIVGVPLIVAGISTLGLAGTFLAQGCVLACVALAMCAVVRDKPQADPSAPVSTPAAGEPSGAACADKAPHAEPARGLRSLGRADLALLALAVLLIGAFASPGPSNYSLLLCEAGVPSASMAAIVSVGGLALTLSKLAFGTLTRRFGAYVSNIVAFCLLAAGMGCSLLIGVLGPVAAVALVVLAGLGFPPATAGPSLWVNDLDPAHYDRSVQRLQSAYCLGTLVGMPVPGLVASLVGSYVPVYAAYAVLALVSLAIIQGRYRKAGLAGGRRAWLAARTPRARVGRVSQTPAR